MNLRPVMLFLLLLSLVPLRLVHITCLELGEGVELRLFRSLVKDYQ